MRTLPCRAPERGESTESTRQARTPSRRLAPSGSRHTLVVLVEQVRDELPLCVGKRSHAHPQCLDVDAEFLRMLVFVLVDLHHHDEPIPRDLSLRGLAVDRQLTP